MGTDIYLSWDGMTEKEEKERYTGFVPKGEVGYLRASIGMVRENGLLRQIFPDEYWDNDTGKGIPYDFIKTWEKNMIYVDEYVKGNSPEYENPATEMLLSALHSVVGIDKIEMSTSDEDIKERAWYAETVIAFLRLGKRKQEEMRNPTVEISW